MYIYVLDCRHDGGMTRHDGGMTLVVQGQRHGILIPLYRKNDLFWLKLLSFFANSPFFANTASVQCLRLWQNLTCIFLKAHIKYYKIKLYCFITSGKEFMFSLAFVYLLTGGYTKTT